MLSARCLPCQHVRPESMTDARLVLRRDATGIQPVQGRSETAIMLQRSSHAPPRLHDLCGPRLPCETGSGNMTAVST